MQESSQGSFYIHKVTNSRDNIFFVYDKISFPDYENKYLIRYLNGGFCVHNISFISQNFRPMTDIEKRFYEIKSG